MIGKKNRIRCQRFGHDTEGEEQGLLTRTRSHLKRPPLYRVLLLNDDYTPMDFVVHVLQKIFRMSLEQATQLMLDVHKKGFGVCGIFTCEVAETKVRTVMAYAKKSGHPLQCTMEPESRTK